MMQAKLDLGREPADFEVIMALSLTQPWATLVAIGAKKYETRSWQSNHRGWLAIHAAKGFPSECQRLCYEQPFAAHLTNAGYNNPKDLPRGEVLAVALLADCISTNRWTPAGSVEFDFGDYGANRFAWQFDDVQRLPRPFAARGALSLWRLPRPIVMTDLATS